MSDNNTKPQPPANLARPDMAEKPTVILGGGPAGLTAGYLLVEEGPAGGRARGGGPGGRHRQDRGARRLPLRPRRPPLLHEGEGGRRPLARDHARGVPRAPADVADLLARPQGAREVPRLPAARPGRDEEARPGRPHQGALLLPVGGGQAEGQGEHLRGVGRQPLRALALQPVLQVVHGEGLGRAHVRDPRRLGRPAHQEPLVLPRRLVRVLRQQGQQGHEPDLEVQLPPLRPRPDVGDDDRRHPEARRPGAPEPQGHPARLRGRPLRARARGRQGVRAVGRGLVAAAAERGRHGEPAPAAPR